MARRPVTVPTIIIDPPGPYASPKELWAFLSSLRELNQNDPAVQEAKEQVMEYIRQASESKPD